MPKEIKMTHIDNGFYHISNADAAKLARSTDTALSGTKLPKHGYEKLVTYNGQQWWLARTVISMELVKGVMKFIAPKQVWSIRLCKEQNTKIKSGGYADPPLQPRKTKP